MAMSRTVKVDRILVVYLRYYEKLPMRLSYAEYVGAYMMPSRSPPRSPPTPRYPSPAPPPVMSGLWSCLGSCCPAPALVVPLVFAICYGMQATPALSPSLSLSAPACHQAETAIWLTCRMPCCCTYIGLAAEQLANLHRYPYSYSSVVVLSYIGILIAFAATLEVAVFPVFRFRRCPCRCGIAVALWSDASSPTVVWAVGSVPVRTMFCNLPPQKQRQSCKVRYRASYFCHVQDEKLPRMSKTRESQGKRDTKKSQSQRHLAV